MNNTCGSLNSLVVLVTNMMIPFKPADLTLNLAAPYELALAFLLMVPHAGLVAASAAEQATAVEAGGGAVAGTSSRT